MTGHTDPGTRAKFGEAFVTIPMTWGEFYFFPVSSAGLEVQFLRERLDISTIGHSNGPTESSHCHVNWEFIVLLD